MHPLTHWIQRFGRLVPVVASMCEAYQTGVVAVPAGKSAVLTDRALLQILVAFLALETGDHFYSLLMGRIWHALWGQNPSW